MPVIDLSVTVNEQTPVYPGDPKPSIKPVGLIRKDGFNDHLVSLPTHVGTHIDAPLHMIDGGKNLSQYPIDRFTGPGKLVDASSGFNKQAVIDAGVNEGDIVLFYTGMSDLFFDSKYYKHYPALDDELADFLISLKVKMVGLDTGSADNKDGFPIHKKLLAADILIIENLTNLKSLLGREFEVFALPLKLEVDGSPARVIAVE